MEMNRPITAPSLWRSRVRAGSMFLATSVLAWRTGRRWLEIVAVVCGVLFVLSVIAAPLYRPIDRVLRALENAVLRAFSWIVLGLAFVVLFVPGRWLLSSRGYRRIFSHQKLDTYWRPANVSTDFNRQF